MASDEKAALIAESVAAQAPASAPPSAANAARRVFRKVTEIVAHVGYNDSGRIVVLVSETDARQVWLQDLLPDVIDPLDGPRGTFRVVVEFTPDE